MVPEPVPASQAVLVASSLEEEAIYSFVLLMIDLRLELRTKEHSGYSGPLNSMSYLGR